MAVLLIGTSSRSSPLLLLLSPLSCLNQMQPFIASTADTDSNRSIRYCEALCDRQLRALQLCCRCSHYYLVAPRMCLFMTQFCDLQKQFDSEQRTLDFACTDEHMAKQWYHGLKCAMKQQAEYDRDNKPAAVPVLMPAALTLTFLALIFLIFALTLTMFLTCLALTSVVIMKAKEFKTKIYSHAHSLIRSHISPELGKASSLPKLTITLTIFTNMPVVTDPTFVCRILSQRTTQHCCRHSRQSVWHELNWRMI